MSTDYRALCVELLTAICLYTKLNPAASEMSAFELTEKLMDAMAATSAALAQSEPLATEGRWSEGVCGDGAAILKDGVMQPIEDVIAALNATALAQPEPVPPVPEVGELGELIAWLHDHALNCRELGRNDWAAQVTSAADLLQQQAAPAPVVLPVPTPANNTKEENLDG